MILLNPTRPDRSYHDERSAEVMRQTIEFFENKGKAHLLEDYYERGWYADFLDYAREHRLFATLCTPEDEGNEEIFPYLGKTVKAATDDDETVRVRMSQ